MNADDVSNYVQLVKQLPKASTIDSGLVYALLYRSSKSGERITDYLPVVLVIDVDTRAKLFRGINMYRLPVSARALWTARMEMVARPQRESERLRRVPDLTFERAKMIVEQAGEAMRTYRFDRIRDMRVVAYNQLDTIVTAYNKMRSRG